MGTLKPDCHCDIFRRHGEGVCVGVICGRSKLNGLFRAVFVYIGGSDPINGTARFGCGGELYGISHCIAPLIIIAEDHGAGALGLNLYIIEGQVQLIVYRCTVLACSQLSYIIFRSCIYEGELCYRSVDFVPIQSDPNRLVGPRNNIRIHAIGISDFMALTDGHDLIGGQINICSISGKGGSLCSLCRTVYGHLPINFQRAVLRNAVDPTGSCCSLNAAVCELCHISDQDSVGFTTLIAGCIDLTVRYDQFRSIAENAHCLRSTSGQLSIDLTAG